MENKEQTPETISKLLLTLNAVLVVLVVCMIFVVYLEIHKPRKKEVAVQNSTPTITSNPFNNLALGAKAVYVYDVVENKVLYKKNEFIQLPLASLTKLMMAVTAVELVPKDSGITIKKEFLREEGDTGLLAGESWKLKDLLDFSLLVSSNDGARSIASVVGAFNLQTEDYTLGREDFVKRMNDKAHLLDLKQTYFVNESGLDIAGSTTSGGYGSAIDVEKLTQYILTNHPEILEATKYQNVRVNSGSKTHIAKNTNTDVMSIPGLMASKTGYTEMAGGNLVVAFDASIGRPIIVVVLGSTLEGRFTDVSSLVKASLDYIRE